MFDNPLVFVNNPLLVLLGGNQHGFFAF